MLQGLKRFFGRLTGRRKDGSAAGRSGSRSSVGGGDQVPPAAGHGTGLYSGAAAAAVPVRQNLLRHPFTGLMSALRRSGSRSSASDDPELCRLISRQRGAANAYRGAVSLLLAAQLLLWLHRAAGPQGRTLWQAAALLWLPGLGLWMLSKNVWSGRGAGQEGLLLLPCLLLDGITLLSALLSLLTRLMPSYPPGILRAVIPLLLIGGTLLGRANGAAYGTALWRRLLVIPPAVLIWLTVSARGTDRLYPILGEGVLHTLRTATGGLGALWPIAALFALSPPAPDRRPAGLAHTLWPLAGAAGMGLALCCAAPWQAGTDAPMGERLLWLGRSSGSITVSGLGAGFWVLLLMLGYCVALHLTRRVLAQACPKLPGGWAAALTGAVTAAALWLWPEALPHWLTALLPWRMLPTLAAALWGMGRKK